MTQSTLNGSFEQGLQRGQLKAKGEPDVQVGSPLASLVAVIGAKIPKSHFRVEYTPADSTGSERLVVKANECFVDGVQEYDFVPSIEIEAGDGPSTVSLRTYEGDRKGHEIVSVDSAATRLGEFCGEYGEDAGTVLAIY